jgi:hypothetical protein
MKELRERSRALQETILRNKALLAELSERVADVLKGRVELPEDQVYVLVPKVYRRPIFLPEVFIAAVDQGVIEDRIGMVGPHDPWVVKILDKQRIAVQAVEKENAYASPADLREQILADPALFAELSNTVAEVLQKHGVTLAADETYAFDALTLRRPIFAGEVSATPLPLPKPPEASGGRFAAYRRPQQVELMPPWFEGVPAPEMLVVLERMRLAGM